MVSSLILVVDDQPFVAEVTGMVLKHAGLQVITATSAGEAASLWEDHKDEIAMLVADYELDNKVTGEELAAEFTSEKPELKTMILSAYPLDSRFRGRTEGVDFFQKPWDVKDVVAAVEKMLGVQRV